MATGPSSRDDAITPHSSSASILVAPPRNHAMRIATILPLLGAILLAACQPATPGDPAPVIAPAPSTTPPVKPGDGEPSAPSAPTPPSTQPPPARVAMHWQCGELLVDADAVGESMRLHFSGRSLTLPHVESLTGARYADDAGNEFMRQGDGAILILAGEEQRQRDLEREPEHAERREQDEGGDGLGPGRDQDERDSPEEEPDGEVRRDRLPPSCCTCAARNGCPVDLIRLELHSRCDRCGRARLRVSLHRGFPDGN